MNKRRCKRISRTNAVGDFDCIAGYFGAVVAELNRAALLAVRDAKGLDVELAEPLFDLGEFLLVQLNHVGRVKQFRNQHWCITPRTKIDIVEPLGVWVGGQQSASVFKLSTLRRYFSCRA